MRVGDIVERLPGTLHEGAIGIVTLEATKANPGWIGVQWVTRVCLKQNNCPDKRGFLAHKFRVIGHINMTEDES